MYRDPLLRAFYSSKSWQKCREAYAASVGYCCERCASMGIVRAGEIVHHIKHLTGDNVCDPSVATSFNNLMLLCRSCHAAVHEEIYGKDQRRYFISERGEVVPCDPSGIDQKK